MKTFSTLLAGTVLVLASSAVTSTATASDEALTTTEALVYLADEQHEDAYKTFRQFLTFGSQDAAYHLGMLSIEGNGTDYDPIKALGYLYAARDWGNEEATEIIGQIEPHLTDEELAEATTRAEALQNEVIIDHDSRGLHRNAEKERREIIKREEPRYPANLARDGHQGWVFVLFAVNKKGNVVDSIVLDSPHRDMARATQRAMRRWKYDTGEQLEVSFVRINFGVGDEPDNVEPFNQAYKQLEQVAQLGGADAQFFLSNLVSSTANSIDGFVGADDSADDWLIRSAANGHMPAQRALAIANMHDSWARYLIEKGDAETKAWYGVQLVSNSSDQAVIDEGRTLVEQAAEAGYRPAQRLLAAFDD